MAWWGQNADQILRNICKSKFDLDVKLTSVKGRQVSAPAALDEMPAVALPFVLQGENESAGLFVLDGLLIDGLIEQQLLGRILPTARLDRPVTSIDAGLSEGFVRACLAGMGANPPRQLINLTCQAAEQDRAALRLALGDGRYDILEADIELGAAVKTGRFEIWVPAMPEAVAKPGTGQVNPDMIALLQDCEIELEAWLERCETSAKQLLELEVGAILPLPKTALTKVDVLDAHGERFAHGRLGQLNGARAVRLTSLTHGDGQPGLPKPADPPAVQPPAAVETVAAKEPPVDTARPADTASGPASDPASGPASGPDPAPAKAAG